MLAMSPNFLIQTPDGTWVYFDQAGCALEATAIGQMFSYRNRFFLWNFAVPQGRVFAFAEFFLATTTAQITNLVTAIYFSNEQVCAAFLTVQIAIRVDTC